MENTLSGAVLFEVSWEVCNKVGGIYAVVTSKAMQAVETFGDDYYLIGPDLGNNFGFEETDEPCWDILIPALGKVGLNCRLGRWDIPGRPKVILVNFKDRYNQTQLLYSLWTTYGVDSLSGGWDYIEPVMFSTAASEVIAAASKELALSAKKPVLAQFHEWMCGAGLLDIKKRRPKVSTVFTTHATILGRAMAGAGLDIYKQMNQINPKLEAGSYNIMAKFSMEAAAAREADCFTTVSRLTGEEASVLLGRAPDVITHNGLDLRVIPDYTEDRHEPEAGRGRILAAAGRLLRWEFPENTRICLTSGRYEFHNKGIDVFLDALAGVNKDLAQSESAILAICAVMGGHNGVNYDAVSGANDKHPDPSLGQYWISSHHVQNPANDPILKTCARVGLDNRPENRVKVIFIPALLDGHDGFLNMTYYDVLSACDRGVFPSWYEPWGYTPQESAALAVPTVTTDLSGFGNWVRDVECEDCDKSGVTILPRRQISYDNAVAGLRKILNQCSRVAGEELTLQRKSIRGLAKLCTWQKFFPYYIQAYEHAQDRASERSARYQYGESTVLTRLAAANTGASPVLHCFTAVAELPAEISRLRELAGNLWWSWRPEARELFSQLDPDIWRGTGYNPVLTIERTDPAELAEMARDKAYLRLYQFVMRAFDAYMKEEPKESGELKKTRPVAYFSMEFGISECLPIYSGGLGVLSGDHLKSASDLNIPLVGVGLLYKSGYFHQQIDKDGRQVALYPENNFTDFPVERVTDSDGIPLDIQLDLPGRKLHAQIWMARVGRIKLYLMDTDMPGNTPDDRRITARLYEADRDFRLRQEILLGIGGIRLLRAVGVQPAVYHMNEGHSAFLVLERIRLLMKERKMSFAQAEEYVRGNNIFTTHTPVEAGNEHFTIDRMEPYFMPYAQLMGISWNDFLRTGRLDGSERNVFEMTVLALNYSYRSNGVSAMHGVVSRHLWQKNWPGVPTPEVPIGSVTNGVHVPSYAGGPMSLTLLRHLGENWAALPPGDPAWEKIMEIPDTQIWNARQQQRGRLLDAIRATLPAYFKKYGIHASKQKEMLGNLNSDALVIGFARRFAPYKRARLLFADPDRLAQIVGNPERPVLFVFSGKAHPADAQGADILQTIIKSTLDERFFGRMFFIEDYGLSVARQMVQGCDVWLNTPRRPHEASGTSGQKVSCNGGLNLSISDGWWCEGYDGFNGWCIGPAYDGSELPEGQSDYDDAESLYALLEERVIPLFFDIQKDSGLPREWVRRIKRSMQTLIAPFHSNRMVNEYHQDYYLPAAQRREELKKDDFALARRLAAWKQDMASRFATLKVEQISVEGLDKEILTETRPLKLSLIILPGDVRPDEILVQLVAGPGKEYAFIRKPAVVNMTMSANKDGKLVYEGEYAAGRNGRHVFGARVMPVTPGLGSLWETRLVLWA